MFENPFTPIFGGKPECFFGRKAILSRFERALEVRGSEDRTLFITGTRGSGKTALVEQLSQQARNAEWDTFDLTADETLKSLFRHLRGYDEISTSVDPHIEVKNLGSGGSLSGKTTTNVSRYDTSDINMLFKNTCDTAKKGVLVSIDEIQKVPLEDVSKICGAFQMASRKGCDAILVVAGLPYAFQPAIQHDGCTYLRRSVHEELTLFTPEETRTAFVEAFARVKGISLEEDALNRLVRQSSGHPYLMQLLGFHLIEYLNGKTSQKRYVISPGDVEATTQVAIEAYERRALQPLVESLSDGELAYLRAIVEVLKPDHTASTGEVAMALGKTHQQVGGFRQALIDEGIIATCGYGRIRFAIPYLRTFLAKPNATSNAASLLAEWDV